MLTDPFGKGKVGKGTPPKGPGTLKTSRKNYLYSLILNKKECLIYVMCIRSLRKTLIFSTLEGFFSIILFQKV